jgi:hypothetical protein
MITIFQRAYAPLKKSLPRPVANAVRSTVTALAAPPTHFWKSGHFRSSFAMRAVDNRGRPLPWYTYPCIHFLLARSFEGRSVLEFGAGQSTYWWGSVADRVVSFEADAEWYAEVAARVPANVDAQFISSPDAETCIRNTRDALARLPERRFDLAVIDGEFRAEMIDIAAEHLTADGAIIADNSEGYGFHQGFLGRGFQRVDFYGAAPGVINPGCTSIFFREGNFLFNERYPIVEGWQRG